MFSKVLLTGGTGFIGFHLRERLLERGKELRLLVRNPKRFESVSRDRVEWIQGNIEKPKSLDVALEGVDAVVHVAGLIHARKPSDFFRVNAAGTRNLIEKAIEKKVSRFVYLSSLAAGGPRSAEQALKEEDAPNPVSDYGLSKLEGEKAVFDQAEKISVTVLRPPAVYGAKDRGLLQFYKMVSRGYVPLVGSREMRLSVISAQDLSQGICLALDSPQAKGRLYHLSSKDMPSVEEVLALMGRALFRKHKIIPVPYGVAWSAALISEAWNFTLGSSSFLSRDKLKELRAPGWCCSTERAQKEIQFRASTPLEEGLRKTAEWYRGVGWLR